MQRIWVYIIHIALCIIRISSYSFTGYDCRKPTNIQEYNIQNFCKINESNLKNKINQTVSLLQFDPVYRKNGFSCTKTVSSFKLYCGAFSHEKIPTVPHIEIKEMVDEKECQRWINQKRYVSSRGAEHSLLINTENIFYETPIGQVLVRNDNVECQGETMKINNQLLDQVVEMKQIKIVISKDKFKFKGNRAESRNQHVQLPSHCHMELGGCSTSQATYIWELGEEHCPLEKVRTTNGNIINQTFVDEDNLIRIKLLEPSNRNFPGCPDIPLITTEYNRLFITLQNTEEFPTITETAIDIAEYIATREDFLMYEIEKKLLNVVEDQDVQGCERNFHLQQQKGIFPWKTKENIFAQFQGEVLSIFSCDKVNVNPRDENECYEELPIIFKEEQLFLQPITHRITQHGSRRPCEKIKTPKYQTNEGVWISMSPQIHIEPTPSLMYHKLIKLDHFDMAKGGVFTTTQLQQWQDSVNFEDYKSSINSRINLQACNEESCISNNYHTGGVREMLMHDLKDLSIKDWLLDKLQQMGQICSIIVAVLWILQFFYKVGTICITCKREGASTASKLLYVYLMKDQLLYKELHQMRKENNRENIAEEEDQL